MLTLEDLQHLVDKELPLHVFFDRHEKHSEGAFPLVAGIVTGILIGATVAILFTPRPGREIRSRLAHRAVEPVEHIVERASTAGHEAREQVGRLSSAARVRMQSAVHRQAPSEPATPPPRMDVIDEGGPGAPPAPDRGWWGRFKERFREAVDAGKEAAREKAAEERARYREMTNRPDALSDMDDTDRG